MGAKGETLKEKRHPEITRREFMGSTWKLLNVGAFIALGGHLGSLAVTSISSGHPDSLTCYECRACASPCPWKLDPSGYLVAARVNNPDRRMLAQYNVERYNELVGSREPERWMDIDTLLERDPLMKVVIGTVTERDPVTNKIKEVEKKDPMRIEKAKEELDKLRADGKDADLIDIYEMRAKDSAFYDPLCARCEPACPVALPVTKFIRDVKADEKYR
jgi:L-lactate utilization protein LutB